MTAKGYLVYIDGGQVGKDDRLRKSAAHWGWPISVLPGPFKGWGHRVKAILASAPYHRDQGYTHLLVVDPYDTAMIGSPDELDTALAYHDYPAILLAAEINCSPDPGLAPLFGEAKTKWWYPHSQIVVDLHQPPPPGSFDVTDEDEDQRHWSRLYLGGAPGFAIDRACLVCQSVYNCHPDYGQSFSTADGRLVNRVTGSKPLLLHGNGCMDLTWFGPTIRG